VRQPDAAASRKRIDLESSADVPRVAQFFANLNKQKDRQLKHKDASMGKIKEL
jgi:hypothetical protein